MSVHLLDTFWGETRFSRPLIEIDVLFFSLHIPLRASILQKNVSRSVGQAKKGIIVYK